MCKNPKNRSASIHAESSNEKPYFSAQEPDYKEMITNANLRRRMSRMIKMGVACGLECQVFSASATLSFHSEIKSFTVFS